MKKIINKVVIIAIICLYGAVSCSEDFLKEEKVWSLSTQYYNTPEGLRSLVLLLPSAVKQTSYNQWGFNLQNYGVDEFQLGSDPAEGMWNNYDERLTSWNNTDDMSIEMPWDNCWSYIEESNFVLLKAPEVFTDPNELKDALGIAHFIRGWTYFYMVQQWGGVPLKLTPLTVGFEFPRASREEIVDQVLEDFNEAYAQLTWAADISNIIPGKIYKEAAAHFLAKALLYRQSEMCSDFGAATKDADLSKALTFCDEVISRRPLANNFADLFDYKEPDGANERNPEVILAAQNSYYANQANGRYGNRTCCMFISCYRNGWAGMTRDMSGMREYARCRNTEYAHNVYNRVNDSRFWKSFRTTQKLNSPNTIPSLWTGTTFELGQLSVMYIMNNPDDTRFQVAANANTPLHNVPPPKVKMYHPSTLQYEQFVCPETGKPVPNVIPLYRVQEGKTEPEYALGAMLWPSLSKYVDGWRNDISDLNGSRDMLVARVAETYLIAAEIKIRQSDYAGALTYINKVRERAGYQNGEDRSKYVDGGQNSKDVGIPSSFCGYNSYFLSNNIAETTAATDITVSDWHNLPPEDEKIIATLGLTGDFDRMLCFLLNERSRELMGEMVRWTDLVRTKTLLPRTYAFNEDVRKEGNLQEYHMLRPIPQLFLDGLQMNGQMLTAEQKSEIQNPGYK